CPSLAEANGAASPRPSLCPPRRKQSRTSSGGSGHARYPWPRGTDSRWQVDQPAADRGRSAVLELKDGDCRLECADPPCQVDRVEVFDSSSGIFAGSALS